MSLPEPRGDVGIVGGGLLGLILGYRLAQAGARVTVYERADRLGGLAGTTEIGGVRVDRFYHAIVPTDDRVLALAEELGLADAIRFRPLGVGFYQQGRLASMSTPGELLAFPGLRMRDRLRLVAFVARCRRMHDGAALDDVPLEAWTRATAGDELWERIWRPLFDSKFDGRWDDLPAAYLWARMRRTAGARGRGGREVMGWMRGGYETLADRLAEAITGLGGAVLTGTEVQRVADAGGRAIGVVTSAGLVPHDWVVATQLRPVAERLLGDELRASLPPDRNRYLGVVCLVARLRAGVSPYYALNITDRRIPVTSVVETTHVVDPQAAGGALVYVPRYVDPQSPELERTSADITREYLGHVRTIFPAFREDQVIATQVARARLAEPVHVAGARPRLPDPFPAPGLVLASAAHVYPEIVNAQAIARVAERIAGDLQDRLIVNERRQVAA